MKPKAKKIESKGEPKDSKDRKKKKARFAALLLLLSHYTTSPSSIALSTLVPGPGGPQARDNLRTSEQFVNVNNDESSGRRQKKEGGMLGAGEGRKRQTTTMTVGQPIRRKQLKMFTRGMQEGSCCSLSLSGRESEKLRDTEIKS